MAIFGLRFRSRDNFNLRRLSELSPKTTLERFLGHVRVAALQKRGVKSFSVFLCQKCRDTWREILVKFSACYVFKFPGFGCPNRKISPRCLEAQQQYLSYRAILVAILSQKCFVLVFMGWKRKMSRKCHSAGAWRWGYVWPPLVPSQNYTLTHWSREDSLPIAGLRGRRSTRRWALSETRRRQSSRKLHFWAGVEVGIEKRIVQKALFSW